jgi:hypothetical protein
MVYPVIGFSVPDGPFGPRDSMCNSSQNYVDTYCEPGPSQHSGQDLQRDQSPDFDFPVVAARGGVVDSVGCVSGAGYRINVRGTDGFFYRYYHLKQGSGSVVAEQTVVPGQRLATQGNTEFCSGGSTAHHLHFDRADSEACGASCARGTYISLRGTHATPGLKSNGINTDLKIYGRWLEAMAPFNGDFATAMLFVGWPNKGSDNADANTVDATSSLGTPGRKQAFSTGVLGDGKWRSSLYVHVDDDDEAFLVTANFFKKYASMQQQTSFLGWPLTDAVGSIQAFEGGCIVNQGGTYNALHWGTAPCTLF